MKNLSAVVMFLSLLQPLGASAFGGSNLGKFTSNSGTYTLQNTDVLAKGIACNMTLTVKVDAATNTISLSAPYSAEAASASAFDTEITLNKDVKSPIFPCGETIDRAELEGNKLITNEYEKACLNPFPKKTGSGVNLVFNNENTVTYSAYNGECIFTK